MKKTDNNVEYELLAKEIIERIMMREGHSTVFLKHNHKVKGETGAIHQIDVYWERNTGGIKEIYCIECKKWNSKVKKSDMASFAYCLNDIRAATQASVKGVYVTTVGYQVGAKFVAIHEKISLKTIVLKERLITGEMFFSFPVHRKIRVIFLGRKIRSRIKTNKSNKNFSPDEVEIYNVRGKQVGNISSLIRQHGCSGIYISRPRGKYIRGSKGSLIKLLTVRYKYDIHKTTPLVGHGAIAEGVVNNVIEGKNEIIRLNNAYDALLADSNVVLRTAESLRSKRADKNIKK